MELLELASELVARARPGEQLEAFVARSRRTTVRAYDGAVEALTSAESAGLGIRVVVAGRQGFAHCGTLDPGAVTEALAEARDNAGFGEVDPWAGLAEPDGVEAVVLELSSPELARFAPERKVALALELEKAVRAGDPRIIGVRTAVYGDAWGEAAVASTHRHRHVVRRHLVLAHGERPGLRRVRHHTSAAGSRSGATRASSTWPRRPPTRSTGPPGCWGPGPTPSQRLTVVLDPRVAVSVFGVVGSMLTGERVLKGRSPFADRVGEAIASPLVTLVDDATDARSYGADSHDGEGLATRRNVLIRDGVLQGFLHNAHSARRAGTRSTGSAVRGYASTPGVGCLALAPDPGSVSGEQLRRQVGEGLLVQSVSGLHSGVNPVSGDFSVGAEGVMIRGGELAEPVREVTIAVDAAAHAARRARPWATTSSGLPGGAAGVSVAIARRGPQRHLIPGPRAGRGPVSGRSGPPPSTPR